VPYQLDLADLAAISAPALLLLLWAPDQQLRMVVENGSVWLAGLIGPKIPGPALYLALGLVSGLLDDRQARLTATLVRFPRLVHPRTGPEVCSPTLQCHIGDSQALSSGRMTRVSGRSLSGMATRTTAQQALTVAVLAMEEILIELMPARARSEASRLAHGEHALPIDAVHDVRKPPVLIAGPAGPPLRARPVVAVVSASVTPVAGGTLDPFVAASALQENPRLVGWSHLRIAKSLARGEADVLVLPWYDLHLSAEDVWIQGGVLRVGADGSARGDVVGPERPDVLVMYPVAGQGVVGESPIEVEALERLRETAVRTGGSRQSVVAGLLRAAGQRGVISNVTGPEGLWWRKDRLEMALRWWSRQTGIAIRRPRTVVVTEANVPIALEAFARHGQSAYVKPATGARAEGLHIVPAGEQVRRIWPKGTYVVQQLVDDPYLSQGRKLDLRAYVLMDTASRARSRLLPTILVRRALASWKLGVEIAEITNTSFKQRLGLPPHIQRLDQDPHIPESEKREIHRSVDRLTEDMLDAVFAWRRGQAHSPLATQRVLLWGIDILLQRTENSIESILIEVNIYPQLYRGDAACDQAVDDMLTTQMLPAMVNSQRTTKRRRPPLVKITMLTTRRANRTTAALVAACDRLGAELVPATNVAPGSLVAFNWGLDVRGRMQKLAVLREACHDAGIRLINGNISNKLEQVERLAAAGIRVPRYRFVNGLFQATTAAAEIGFPVVIKPLNGSYSRGIRVIADADDLVKRWPGQPRLMQEFLPDGYRCARILVVGGDVVSAVMRVARDGLLATYDHGRRASLEPFEVTDELRAIAVSACRALDIDIGGVDVVLQDKRPVILEVNHRGVEFQIRELHGDEGVARVAGYLVGLAHARLRTRN
jgi:glutathione synthase/RimK-type ligase-like ATP-grasp enzyme